MARRSRAQAVDLAKLWTASEDYQRRERDSLAPTEPPDWYVPVYDEDGDPDATLALVAYCGRCGGDAWGQYTEGEFVYCADHHWGECPDCRAILHLRELVGAGA